jgi:hypothetical protein
VEVTDMKKLFLSALLLTVACAFTGCSPQQMEGHPEESHAHHVMAD